VLTTQIHVYFSLKLCVRITLRRGVLDTTLCDKVCQQLTTGWWFSPGSPVSSTNKADPYDITEILLKAITLTLLFLHNVNDYNKGQSFSSIYNLSQICLFCFDSVVYWLTKTFTCYASPIFWLCVPDEG
jgi:hypothetical protein